MLCADHMYDAVDEAERLRRVEQFQQQHHYTDQVTATRLPPNYRQTRVAPDDSDYFGPAAASPSVPAFDVSMTTCRIPPVQVPSSGACPQISSIVTAPPAAQQLAHPQPFVTAPAVHINSLLPGHVNVVPPAAVPTTPGMCCYILCII